VEVLLYGCLKELFSPADWNWAEEQRSGCFEQTAGLTRPSGSTTCAPSCSSNYWVTSDHAGMRRRPTEQVTGRIQSAPKRVQTSTQVIPIGCRTGLENRGGLT